MRKQLMDCKHKPPGMYPYPAGEMVATGLVEWEAPESHNQPELFLNPQIFFIYIDF